MANICIPKVTTEKLKSAVQNGDISIQKLYDIEESGVRRAVFEQYVSKDLAKKTNAAFEGAMVSNRKSALTSWAEATFTAKEKKSVKYQNIIDKIDRLDKIGALSATAERGVLLDLIASQMGIEVTADELSEISKRAKKLQGLFAEETPNGLPSKAYFVARKQMDDYLFSLVPTPNLRVATSVAGRGAMLLSIKSPITNIVSNTVQAVYTSMERRISDRTYKGLNGGAALDYVQYVVGVYQASGYDPSRMDSLSYGQRRLGEKITHAQGPGPIRRVGRWYEDFVFKQLMGAPDVAYSASAFADSANLGSTKVAKSEGLTGDAAKARALEIFTDATRISPETALGELVRAQGIADARYSTYTNDGGFSDFAMAIRKALNTASGDLRLGDQTMPFVKTPANVVQAGIDASGVGAFRGFWKLPEARRQLAAGNTQPMRDVVSLFVKSGLGLTLATVLAFASDPDDFVGDYDTLSQKERNLVRLKGASYNTIKIGNKWISLDYLGPLGAPFVGIMYARKYGDDLPTIALSYAQGVGGQSLRFPGVREFGDIVDSVTDAIKEKDFGRTVEGLTNEAIGFIRARVVPGIVNDVAKGTDPSVRRTGRGGLSKFQSSIPGFRQQLPEAVDMTTGEILESDGFIISLLFGSRVRNARQNAVIDEINRLDEMGATPSIAPIDRSSTKVKELEKELSKEEFTDMLVFYGERYGSKATKLIASPSYRRMDDDEKRDALNEVRREAMSKTIKKFD